jgi:hypothetical protein
MLKYYRIEIMAAQHVPPRHNHQALTPLLQMPISQHKVSKILEHVRSFVSFSNIVFVEVLFYIMVSLTRYFLYNSGKKVVDC